MVCFAKISISVTSGPNLSLQRLGPLDLIVIKTDDNILKIPHWVFCQEISMFVVRRSHSYKNDGTHPNSGV